jgi:hypothetical protein
VILSLFQNVSELAAKQKPPAHQGGGFHWPWRISVFSDLSPHIEPETLRS